MMERMTDDEMTRLGRLEYAAFTNRDKATLWHEADRARGSEAALAAAATKAAAELRHAYKVVADGQRIDPNLVARAITLLETALSSGRRP